jgi:hypothetical protein
MRALLERALAWLESRAPRERALLLGAALLAALILIGRAGLAVGDGLALARARVAAHGRDLTEIRRLAAALGRQAPPVRSAGMEESPSLVSRLAVVAEAAVGRERIASMTPTTEPAADGRVEERVALRVSGASLADTVRLLHDLESGSPPLVVTGLTLRKQPDDARRFEASVEVARAP